MSKHSDKYISRVWDDVYALLIKHDFERVEKYISHGFDVKMYDDNLLKACAEMGYLEAVKFLIARGANVGAENSIALYYSADRNHFDVVKVLMESGSNLEHAGILNNKNVTQEIKDWCKAFDKANKLSKNLEEQMSSKDNCGIIKHKI